MPPDDLPRPESASAEADAAPSASRRLRQRFSWLALLLCATFFVAGINVGQLWRPTATPSPATPSEPSDCAAPSEEFALLCEAYDQIKDNYVDDVPDSELVEAAIRGMIEYGLEDPYSGYMSPVDYRGALDSLSGQFGGVGIEVAVSPRGEEIPDEPCLVVDALCAITVVSPLDDTPAAAADVMPGDLIVAVDGESTDGKSPTDLVGEIRGEAGTVVELTLERDGELLEISLTREVIEISPVSTEMLGEGIGYLRLSSFNDDSAAELRSGLEDLLDEGATSLVLDLRSNPGGYIAAASDVASEFIESGVIFTVEDGETVTEWPADGEGILTDPQFPVVVLIDGGSASAAEIVAAALSEHGRATLIGVPTFGKDTVQTWQSLANDGGLRLTIARWYTPEHNLVSDSDGLQPDVLVEEQPSAEVDPALDAAIEALSQP